MKKATKVFLIISIVAGFLVFLGYFIYAMICFTAQVDVVDESGNVVAEADVLTMLVGVYALLIGLVGLVPAILGIIVYRKVSKAQSKVSLAWSIVTLILVNPISGILMLCMKDEDYRDKKISDNQADYPPDNSDNNQ